MRVMKSKLGAVNALYPTPTALVGATVNGKPNFITIAHIGIMTFTHISVSLGKRHHTNAGIKENKTFSVCLPSENLVVETDYCGIESGKDTDKGALFDLYLWGTEDRPHDPAMPRVYGMSASPGGRLSQERHLHWRDRRDLCRRVGSLRKACRHFEIETAAVRYEQQKVLFAGG